MAEFIPDLLMCWATYQSPGSITEIKHQQDTVCKTLGEGYKVGRENDDSISFWDSEQGITVLYAKEHMIASMQLPAADAEAEAKWKAFSSTVQKGLSLSSVPEDFSNFLCNARTYYSTSKDVDESLQHTEKIMSALSHGRKMLDILNAEVIDRQGVNEVQYRTVQNTQNQQYGLSLIYGRISALNTHLSKEEVVTFLHEENVIQQIQDEQKRLDALAQKAITPAPVE